MFCSCNLPLWYLFVSFYLLSSNAASFGNNSFPNNSSEQISHHSTLSTHNTLIQTPTSTLLLPTFLLPNISFSSLLNATSSVDVKAIHTLGVWKNRTVGSNDTFTASTSPGFHLISNSTDDPIVLCDRASSAWSKSRISEWDKNPPSRRDIVHTLVNTYTSFVSTWDCTLRCGNVCYADSARTVSSSLSTRTIKSTEYVYDNQPTLTDRPPNCTIPSLSCLSLKDEYTKSSALYDSWEQGALTVITPLASPSSPACGITYSTCNIIATGDVQLYYWPPTETVSRDMCTEFPHQESTYVAIGENWIWDAHRPSEHFAFDPYSEVTTGPSAIVGSHTFYSGNIYLLIPFVGEMEYRRIDWAGGGMGLVDNRTFSNVVLTLASTHLRSFRFDTRHPNWQDKYMTYEYSVNYADFADPVPWSAYRGMITECLYTDTTDYTETSCRQSVVLKGQYRPHFMMPNGVRSLHPGWSSCALNAFHLRDPPTALSTASQFHPTPVGAPIITSARPGSTPQSLPVQTSVLEPSRLVAISKKPNTPIPTMKEDPGRPETRSNLQNVQPPDISQTEARVDFKDTQLTNIIQTRMTPALPGPLAVTIGPSIFTLAPDVSKEETNLIFDAGTTIRHGGADATVNGSTVRVGNHELTISDNTGTRTLPIPRIDNKVDDQNHSDGVISIGGQIFTVDADENLVKPGITVRIGDPATTINGVAVSAGTSGIILVDPANSQVKSIPFTRPDPGTIITAGMALMTIAPGGGLIVAPGTTLHAGDPSITVDGTIVGVGTDGKATAGKPQEKTTVVDTDGVTTILDPNGITTVKHPSGTTIVLQADGSKTTIDYDGTTVAINPQGMTTLVAANGVSTLLDPNETGPAIIIGPHGTSTVLNLDGNEGTMITGSNGAMTPLGSLRLSNSVPAPQAAASTSEKPQNTPSRSLIKGTQGTRSSKLRSSQTTRRVVSSTGIRTSGKSGKGSAVSTTRKSGVAKGFQLQRLGPLLVSLAMIAVI